MEDHNDKTDNKRERKEQTLSIVFIAAIALQLLFSALIYREVKILRMEIESGYVKKERAGLAVGDPAPPVSLTDPQGSLISLDNYPAQKIMLVFISSGCPYCTDLLNELSGKALMPENEKTAFLIFVNKSDKPAAPLKGNLPIIAVPDDIFDQYRITTVPYAYLIDAGKKIEKHRSVHSRSDILNMLGIAN